MTASSAGEPEQLELLVGPIGPATLPSAPDEIAALVRRAATLETRLTTVTDHFRRRDAAVERGDGRSGLHDALRTLGRWADGLWCQAAPPSEAKPAPLPRISIVTPVLNARETIAETIESVLGQAYPNLEYIVVDGGSTDGTREIIRGYADRLDLVIAEPDDGLYDAVAKGFARATGEVFAWLDADDLYLPGGLDRVGRHFAAFPDDRVIYFENLLTIGDWRFANQPLGLVDFRRLLDGHFLFQDGVFFRRIAHDAVGGLDRTLRLAGDWAFWLALARRYPLRRLDGHVSAFRVRSGQLSEDMAGYEAEAALVSARLASGRSRAERLAEWPGHIALGLIEWLESMARRLGPHRRLYFPLALDEDVPGPRGTTARPPAPARCPVSGSVPKRLLFSSPDTRFGEPGLNEIWYHPENHVAAIGPELDRTTLRRLHEWHYGGQSRDIRVPAEESASPFRYYRGSIGRTAALAARLVPAPLRRSLVPWADPTMREMKRMLRGLLPRRTTPLRVLDLACFEGELLDGFRADGWQTFGCDSSERAAEAARSKGHGVWLGGIEDALRVIPIEERFDLVILAQALEHATEPLMALQRAARLLEPDGLILISTPNLDSAQIERFGPTWAHWHPPFQRFVFSARTLAGLARSSGLRLLRTRTWSHPYWSWLSLRLNQLGLMGAVPHGLPPDPDTRGAAETTALAARLFQNWRGRGDYLYAVLKPDRRS
ncbi:MAG TPA: glycosyltransferase [Aliidongia sp.]|uniref:glycosyltransferase n=1 Tax=Aliidongia sp. TaxID=1914230 RepID=UPI002DDC936E|nr:glycosyltransferase [Aliidongia sp.]HEV2674635.1 glycosyltransferase [Aliidongia sp.]